MAVFLTFLLFSNRFDTLSACQIYFNWLLKPYLNSSLPSFVRISFHFLNTLQVVNLQAQLASLKEQATQSFLNGSATTNPNDKLYGKPSYPLDLQSWFQSENSSTVPQLNPNNLANNMPYCENGIMDPNSMGNYGNSTSSFDSFEEASHSMSSFDMQTDNLQWTYQHADDLQSMAFGYTQHS